MLADVTNGASLSGFSGLSYVWEILRLCFISSLYRLWTRASICVQHQNGQGVHYESRHIVLSTIALVRVTMRLDTLRAFSGVSQVHRDGSVSQNDRFSILFNSSWIACGWIARGVDDNLTIRFGSSFPNHLILSDLLPINIPSHGRVSPGVNDFVV